ncbi:MAG: arginine deiminase family protein [Candidatus Thorarchaeota archaeon]
MKPKIPKEVKEMLDNKMVPSIPVPLDYDEELGLIWDKNWGAQSEIGKLREVLVNTPGIEMGPPESDIAWYQMRRTINVEEAKGEHESLVKVLKDEGVKVHYLNPDRPPKGPYGLLQRLWATRDPGFVIKGGAIVGRMSLPFRSGDQVYWTQRVVELGCPILYTVSGSGTFEGGNVVWLDPEHVCIGVSARTNQEGFNQVADMLYRRGVEEVKSVSIPGWLRNLEWPAGGFAHLDCVFAYVDDGIALVYPAGIPYDFIEYLREKQINMLEVPPHEAKDYACNVVALQPGKIVLLDGFPETKRMLDKEGVDSITVEMSEFTVSGGGPHCSTSPLIRDSGPQLG